MTDIASLGLEVKSEQADKGTKSLDQLSAAAARAETRANRLAASSKRLEAANSTAAEKAARAALAEQRLASAQDRATAAIERQTRARQRANGVSDRVDRANRPANQNDVGASRIAGAGAGNVANIAAQFQDIAVQAQGGTQAMTIALQQGTQLAYVFALMENPILGVAKAIRSVFSFTSLATVGLVALVAVGVQMVNWPKAASAALNGLADVLEATAPYAVGVAAALALIYSPAILAGLTAVSESILSMTAYLGGLAIGFALANPAVAFIAGIALILVALNYFRDELASIFGRDIVEDVKTGVNFIIGIFAGAYAAILASWKLLPGAIADLINKAANWTVQGVASMINGVIHKINYFIGGAYNAISGLAGKLHINIGTYTDIDDVDLGGVKNPYEGAYEKFDKAAQDAFDAERAKNTNYVGIAYKFVGEAASDAAGKVRDLAKAALSLGDGKKKKGGRHGKTDEDKYGDIVTRAEGRLSEMQAEQATIGMSELATAKLKYETELLNEARQKGIVLTDAQSTSLMNLADEMAETEVATKKAKEALDFAKDATKGFISDLISGLEQGKSLWESFGDAALNVLDKIIDKIEDNLVNALFEAQSAGGGGGGIGGLITQGLGMLFGGISGGGAATGGGMSWLDNTFRADGGPVSAGKSYIVGERRPEVFTPSQSGYIHPSVGAAMSGGGSGGVMGVKVDVGVSVDQNGNLDAYVRSVSRKESSEAVQGYRSSDMMTKDVAGHVKKAQSDRFLT